MSESVEILIAAEDRASSEFKKVEQSLDGLAKRTKELGGKTKASVEIFGSLANALGGSQLGAFSSELAGITEKVSAFSEVSKGGAAGAFAFKAGLAAATAIVSFKVGEAIGGWVFQTEKWAEALEKAKQKSIELGAAQKAALQEQFANKREDISLIADPAEREKATKAREAQLMQEKIGAEASVKMAERQLALAQKQRDAWTVNSTLQRGEMQAAAKNAEEAVKQERERLSAIDAEWRAVQMLTSERTKDVEARKAANEAAAKSSGFIQSLQDEVQMMKASREEQIKLEAARNAVPADQAKAEALLREREALKAKAEEQKKAEAEAEQAARKEEDAIKRIADLEKKRVVDLEARRIELEKGREAAAAYRLEQDGLTKASAERLASLEEEQRMKEESAGKAKNLQVDSAPQQALQGRLLTSGTGGDPMLMAANKTVTNLEKLNAQLGAKLDALLYESQKQRGFTVKTAVIP